MSKYFPVLLVAIVLFASCNIYTSREKLQTYKQIAGINDTLDKQTREWHHLLDIAIKTKNYSALMPYRIELGRFISRSRSAIGNLKVNAVSESLLDSEQVFLQRQADIVSEQYTIYESYNEFTNIDIITDRMKIMNAELNNEIATHAAMKRSLTNFAKKAKIKVK